MASISKPSSYYAWLAKHPSALDSFEKMMKQAKGKNLAVFLDYDGTLSPIVDDPNQAFMSDKMRSALGEVACVFPTAIVSGRSLSKVKAFVQLHNVTYAGSHGMDILTRTGSSNATNHHQMIAVDDQVPLNFFLNHWPGNEVIYFQPARDFLPAIKEILKVLEEKTKSIKGSMVEDNGFCISVHFRRVNLEDVDTLEEVVQSTLEAFRAFHVTRGNKVMEIRPRIDWNKGHALRYLIRNLGFDGCSNFLPLYIGDDKTDEDAFKVIREIGRGYPIIVSSIPKETKASYSLRDTNEVMDFLIQLVNWEKIN